MRRPSLVSFPVSQQEKFPPIKEEKAEKADQNTPEENVRLKNKIESAQSLGDIVHLFITAKGIAGSDKFYSKEEISQSLFSRAWHGKFKETEITRNLGLREKVNELLKTQEPFMKNAKETWQEIERKVSAAKSIGALSRVVYEYAGVFTPENKTYTALDIINGIAYAREHKKEEAGRFQRITSAFGIRKKARQLIEELEATKK